MKTHTIPSLLAALCATLLSACAGGTQYSDARKSGALAPHNGKGLLLIYWEPGFVSAAFKPYLYVNQVQQPRQLSRGGFCSYEAAPGPLNVAFSQRAGESTPETRRRALIGGIIFGGALGAILAVPGDIKLHSKHSVDINVLPNETHYVMMVGAGGSLKEVSQAAGEEQIKKCHWLNGPAN